MSDAARPGPAAGRPMLDLAAWRARLGEPIGPSPWRRVEQQTVDRFAEITGDRQWIHVDPVRARRGPFGAPIAHGYLTLALIPTMLRELVAFPEPGLTVNYGLNRVRFPAPIPVGAATRLVATALAAEPAGPGGFQVVLECRVAVAGQAKPACIAECVVRWHPRPG